jgi:hypothetical protein
MLNYIRSIGLPYTFNSQWENFDATYISISSMFDRYQSISIVITTDNNIKYYLLEQFITTHRYFEGNIIDFHKNIANKPITFIPTLPNSNIKYVRYENAYRCGYSIDIALTGRHYNKQTNKYILKDAKMIRSNPTTDMQLLKNYCLISVDGLFHRIDASKSEAYILDAGITLSIGNRNHIGILSFQDIATLEIYKPTDTDIVSVDEYTKLYEKMFINTPDMSNKYPILVLGGYLFLPQADIFYKVSNNKLALCLQAYPYLERIIESVSIINLDSLGINRDMVFNNSVSVDALLNNNTIHKYFNLSQSFLVLVNYDKLFYQSQTIRTGKLPGIITVAQEPTYPLFSNYGRLLEYWKHYEYNKWCVTSEDSHYKKFVANTDRPSILPSISNALEPHHHTYRSYVNMLKIGAYK